ncbi:MAG TPA: hypothetical protein VID29_06530 [Solirubrobacteraceae bacterium]|jgi:hypothetical protein
MARAAVFLVALVFVLGFAVLTLSAVASQGFTLLGVVSVLVVAVMGFGILGALLRGPGR